MTKAALLLVTLLFCAMNLSAQSYERYKKLVDTTIISKHLGFAKNITVTVPFEWQADLDRDFPLIIVFDRQNPRSHSYILNTIDYLTSNEQMPSSIIISVESEQQYRYVETSYAISDDRGLAAENEKFIFDELISLAENTYKASKFRLLIGHSRYGYYTSALFCNRTEDLSGVISMSPFFNQPKVSLTDSMFNLSKEKFSAQKYYRYGIGEDYPDDFFKMDSTLNILENSHIDTKGFYFEAADHNATPGLTIGISLYEIFEMWSKSQAKYFSNDQKDLKIISTAETEIFTNYGSVLTFSLGILNGKGWFFYNENEFEKAIEAWELMLKNYPNFSEGYLYIIDAQKQLKQDYSATLERFRKSMKTTKIYSEGEKEELLKELKNMLQ